MVQDCLQLLPEIGPAVCPRQQVRDRSVTSLVICCLLVRHLRHQAPEQLHRVRSFLPSQLAQAIERAGDHVLDVGPEMDTPPADVSREIDEREPEVPFLHFTGQHDVEAGHGRQIAVRHRGIILARLQHASNPLNEVIPQAWIGQSLVLDGQEERRAEDRLEVFATLGLILAGAVIGGRGVPEPQSADRQAE